MLMISNPILRGFNPDPSIIRVGDDFYVATSTFEWYPGVQIHHSKDLVNWELITHPLNRLSQLNMVGDPDSGGVWAPCLSYDKGIFYLIYSDVKTHIGPYKDVHNYLVTATDIKGPWSEPIYLNSSGFDPSLYHDEDGTKWLLNLKWSHRKGKNKFGGIIIQQYDEQLGQLVGEIKTIYHGTELGLTEGPHIYKHNGYYYLFVAEGGTRYGHAATVARSKTLLGMYETDPSGPLVTSRYNDKLALQRSGHASLVSTQDDEWYIAHLCGRPVANTEYCILGRETALQRVQWTEDSWIRLTDGGYEPKLEVPAPQRARQKNTEKAIFFDDFEDKHLNLHWNSLREPITDSWATTQLRQNWLRIFGRESLYSKHHQSLVARRQQAFSIEVETKVEYFPTSYQQMAGLIYYYNTNNHYYLTISYDESLGKCLYIISSNNGAYDEPMGEAIVLNSDTTYLRLTVEETELQFYYSEDGQSWVKAGPVLDATIISDEHAENLKDGTLIDQGFTGGYVGICAQDLGGTKLFADFDYFRYEEK